VNTEQLIKSAPDSKAGILRSDICLNAYDLMRCMRMSPILHLF